jgi:hypothetical protein
MGRTQELRTIYVVIPSYGDNKSVLEITSEIEVLVCEKLIFCILDDSAGVDTYPRLPSNFYIFVPGSNMGQQSILVNFIRHTLPIYFNHTSDDLVLILDGDGEDAPININKMLKLLDTSSSDIVVATRGKRHVKVLFKISYVIFQILGLVLCNRIINHGTFSLSKRGSLENAVKKSNFDYSFVGGIIASRMSKRKLKCHRHPRRFGKSNLNKIDLIRYGLRVYVGIRPKVSSNIYQLVSTLIAILTITNIHLNITVKNFQLIPVVTGVLIFYFSLNTFYLASLILLKASKKLNQPEKFVVVNW